MLYEVITMSREDFEAAVDDALDAVPDQLLELVDNVVILVEDDAPDDDPELLGLYDGVSLTDRGADWGMGELPDRIFIFRNPTLAVCETPQQVREEVAITVVHEIAHHFGIDDERVITSYSIHYTKLYECAARSARYCLI